MIIFACRKWIKKMIHQEYDQTTYLMKALILSSFFFLLFFRTTITFFISSLWHGMHAGYYFSLFSVPFYLFVESVFQKRALKGGTHKWVSNLAPHIFRHCNLYKFSIKIFVFSKNSSCGMQKCSNFRTGDSHSRRSTSPACGGTASQSDSHLTQSL